MRQLTKQPFNYQVTNDKANYCSALNQNQAQTSHKSRTNEVIKNKQRTGSKGIIK